MNKIVGFDVGTGNLCSAQKLEKDKIELKSMRNMFLSVEPDKLKSYDMANTYIDYVEQKDDNDELESIAIIGEDAYVYANMFNKKVRRPMAKGVISSTDIDAMDIVSLMVEKMIGRGDNGYVVFSVPAQAIDTEIPPVLYHEKVFSRIFSSLGYTSRSMNEGMSVVFSECENENFSGLGISFGSGLTNVACSYKGTPTLTFSISRAGDWIDNSVADSLGVLSTRVTAVKERDLDLMNPKVGNKRERQVREALYFFYENLINYVLDIFVDKFNESAEGLNIDESIPIVLSGGTSLPKGFDVLFEQVFREKKNFPYDISEVRRAKDPLAAVANGNLIYGLWKNKKNIKKEKRSNE